MLLIGKLERYKGADLLLQAAAGLPSSCPVRVVLAGACTEAAYLAALRELAREAGPRAIVRLERIPDEEMATYLDSADFAVFPFRAVTNSSSVLLAQSFGLPVLVPNLASLSDLPEETVLRYDPCENGLEQALERAAELSDQVREEMGRAAQAYRGLDGLADRGPPAYGPLRGAAGPLAPTRAVQAGRPRWVRPARFFWAWAALTSSAPSRSREAAGSNSFSRARPLTRRSAARAGSRILRSPSAIAAGSRGSTRTAASPATSTSELLAAVTTGVPTAKASSKGSPNPS